MDFAEWRVRARTLIRERVPPEHAQWCIPEPLRFTVPRSFLEVAEDVALYRDPVKWAVLYRVLWRLNRGQRHLMSVDGDVDVRELRRMQKAVRRDIYNMKGLLHFRQDGDRLVAWHRPEHLIVERVAQHFVRQMPDKAWSIVTPDASADWDGNKLLISDGAPEPVVQEEKEMPKTSAAPFVPPERSLPVLQQAVQRCQGCDLYKYATQAVFGEGVPKARVMFVGEQPGDQEDLKGRPFVGPAGRILDQAMQEAELDRSLVYVTNAVKHFKFEERGKRRIHKTPSAGEVAACRPWLEAEIELVKPKLIVALGATAAVSLMGKDFRVTRERGRLFPYPGAEALMATVHPSSLLRVEDKEQKELEYRRFVEDMVRVREHLNSAA